MAKSKKIIATTPALEPMKTDGLFNSKNKLLWIVGLVVLIVALVLFKNPKIFVAGVVNNQPIMTFTLNDSLQKKFGSRLLDQMIDEILIKNEAQKQGVSVTKAEIDSQLATLQNQMGGKDALDQLLLQQGITMDELYKQLELKLLVDKILIKEVKVTDKDIEDYINTNKDLLPATDSASQKIFAENAVKQQKLSTAFQKWYQDLKSKSKIYKFL